MKAKDLRNSILQMAVQGKLVPQDPNDEPASVLLESILEERAKLIAEKKIKFPKGGESVIYRASDGSHYEKRIDAKGHVLSDERIEDEIPFEVPEGWEWVRLGNLLSVVSDGTHKTPDYKDEGVLFLSVQNISKGYFDLSKAKYISQETHAELSKRVKPQNGDILLCRIGTLGKPIIVNVDYEFSIFVSLGLLRPTKHELAEWIVACIDSPLGFDWIEAVKVGGGTHTFKINLGDIPSFLVPLPPLAEQRRVEDRIAELMPLVDEYGAFEEAREALDSELTGHLRKSVLQQAVQGRLVPQDPSDEPASVLLERIRKERAKLVAGKKIKFPKGGESVIYRASDGGHYEKRIDAKGHVLSDERIEDEIPFEIPEGWEWARFSNVIPVQYGFPAESSQFSESGPIGLIRIRDVNSGDLMTTSVRYSGEWSEEYLVHSGDDLIGMDGEFRCRRWRGGYALLNQRVCCLRYIPNSVCRDYVSLAINWYLEDIWKRTSKTTVKHLSAKALDSMLFAIPPLVEQRRIAERINDIFSHLTNQ